MAMDGETWTWCCTATGICLSAKSGVQPDPRVWNSNDRHENVRQSLSHSI